MERMLREALPESSPTKTISRHTPLSAEAEKLALRVERAVRRETTDKVRELRVQVRSDSLVLVGRCGTYYTKQLAQHAAMNLAGDKAIDNQIEVW